MRLCFYLLALIFLICPSFIIAQSCEKLIWADEFDGESLDFENWNFNIGNGCPELCGWGNNEQQYYTDTESNLRLEDGKLIMTARQDSVGGMDFSSARISTKDKVDFRYGRIEARIKLPETQGLWPAFWMLPTENVYGEWPKSGEIDIFELVGHEPETVFGTLHTGLPWSFITDSFSLEGNTTFAEDFHLFSLEWKPDTIRWFADNVQYHQLTSSDIQPWQPFNEEFHLLLNVAVGGNLPGPPDETTMLPQTMEVDYIRVYSKPADLTIKGDKPVIGQTGHVLSTFGIEGASYNWSVPAGSMISSGQGTNSIEIEWGCTAGDVTLDFITDCDSVQLVFSVPEFKAIQIEGDTLVEILQEGNNYMVPLIGNATYTWTLSGDGEIVSGQNTNVISVDWGCEKGILNVMVEGNCGNTEYVLEIDMIDYKISGPLFFTENEMGEIYSIQAIPSATDYAWTVPIDASIASGEGTNQIEVNFGSMPGLISVEVNTDCGVLIYSLEVKLNNSTVYCNFDEIELDFGDFGGSVFEKIDNPFSEGINTSGHVGKTRKDPGSVSWAGIYADIGDEIDFESNPLIQMKVFSESEGIIKFKIEDQTTGQPPFELDIPYETAGEWVDMVWDFSSMPSEIFDRIALFFDFGSTDTSFWYFDDILGSSLLTGNVSVLEYQFDVYPNPASQFININFNGAPLIERSLNIDVFDSSGRSIYKRIIEDITSPLQMPISSWNPGPYYLVIRNGSSIYVKPFIKAGK